MSEWWVEERGGPPTEKGPTITEIKASVSIRKVLEYYGAKLPALRSFGWVSIKCPFHEDARASASFNDKTGRFHCHTCDVGGDVIDVVAWEEKLSVKDTLQWLKDKLG